jgi:UDP-glucose 4-epimerase
MNCLVLGGGGFLGSHLCEALVQQGYGVRILERRGFPKGNLRQIADRIDVVEGGFDDPLRVEVALRGIEVVFHLVSTTLPKSSNDDPSYDVASNVLPTLRFLEAARKGSVKKLVFFSSGGTVYGIPEWIPITEDHPTNPICSYGIHKLTVEKYLGLYSHLYGVNTSVLRISNAYGERQSPTAGQGAIAAFLFRALRRETIEIWGDGSVVRDYIHVSDVARAATSCIGYTGNKQVFNVGSGIGISLVEVLEAVERAVGHRVETRFDPSRPLDVPINVLETSRARAELSWAPTVGFTEGLDRTLGYIRGILR